MSKIITLVAAGYVSCVAGDIGKQVKDDGTEIGALLGYNNTTREWWIDATTIVVSGSAMTITAGTGAGTSVTVYYCTVQNVKDRLLIAVATYDTEIALAIQEAEDYINEKLRPYLSYRQTLTLLEADYTNCVSTDIGKEVMDDEVKVGKLLDYNNTTRIWKIKTTSTIADASEIKLSGGTGKGTADGGSTDDVTEAESPIFIFKTLPLSATIPDQIVTICGDLAAGVYLRRKEPEDFDKGWWLQGIKKLEDFIKGNWHRGVVVFC